MRSQFIGKDRDAQKDWGQEEKGVTEDGMIGWHHWLSGHEFGQTLRDSDGQRSLTCYSPWGHKDLGLTEHLNWTDCISDYFFDCEGYSISFKGFLPTVDIMVIWIKFFPFQSILIHQFLKCWCSLLWASICLFDHFQFTLIHGPAFQVSIQYCSLQHWT